MMRHISCEEKLNKSVLCIQIKKKKDRFWIKETKDNTLINRKKNIIYCYTDFDFDIQTVFLQPVKDKKTKELLIRRKLGITDKEVILRFIEVPSVKQNEQILHYVYIAKLKTKINRKNIKNLTLSQIAIHNISSLIKEDIYIYHCFADDEKLILNISRGKILIYSRVIEIPDNEKKDPINFFYENINLTYHYILQNKSPKIDLIILSGQMFSSLELSKLVYTFSNIPVATIFHKSIVENINEESFHKILIPMGAVLTEDIYNFLPDKEKEEKTFNTVLSYINILLISILLISGYFLFLKISDIDQKISSLQNLNNRFIKEQNQILKKVNINIDSLSYYENYIKTFLDAHKFHPYFWINQLEDLFKYIKINNINIKKDMQNFYLVITLNTKKQFQNFSQMEIFRHQLEKILQKLSDQYEIENRTQYDFPLLQANVDIVIKKPI